MKPRVYLAGPTEIHDWRHTLVPELNVLPWRYHFIELPTYIYVGPFFSPGPRLCGCSTWEHATSCSEKCGCDLGDTELETAQKNAWGLAKADLVLAHISEKICPKTSGELRTALAQKTRVVISVSSSASQIDIPEAYKGAHRIHKTADLGRFKSDLDFEVQEVRLALLYGDA